MKNTGITIAQVSDLHYCAANLDEADRCFASAIEQAIAAKVKCVVISGDLTEHGMETKAPAYLRLAGRLQELAQHCPVLIVQGTWSHEPPGSLALLGRLHTRYPIWVSDKVETIALAGSAWVEYVPGSSGQTDAVFSTLPTLHKGALAASLGERDIDQKTGTELTRLLAQMGPMHEALRLGGIPTILVGHGTVEASQTETGRVLASLDHEFSQAALFASGADAIMLGHIHCHQSWESRQAARLQVIAYPGSIGRFHYGHAGQTGGLLWQVAAGRASFSRLITPSREMIDLSFDQPPSADEVRAVAGQCRGAWVRVLFPVAEEQRKTVDIAGIRHILLGSGAIEVKMQMTTIPMQRQRAPGISLLPLTVQLARWAAATQVELGVAEQWLLERLGRSDLSAEAIVTAALSEPLDPALE